MKNWLLAPLLWFAFTACSSPSLPHATGRAPEEALATKSHTVNPTPLPRTYWALDTATQKSDTLLAGQPPYHIRVITTCLNDSAVVNRIRLDTGPALDVSHNYVSELLISQRQQPWLHERLTKALFQQNALVQTLGPLQELALSRTAFLAYAHGQFRFTTRLGVPDSDIFVEAEVAVIPGRGVQLVQVQRPPEEAE